MEAIKKMHQANDPVVARTELALVSTTKPFITANTMECTLEEIKAHHVIPVFVKDNEPVISHSDFIESTMEIAKDVFHGETIVRTSIMLFHEIKGRYRKPRINPPKSSRTMSELFITNGVPSS
jgi:hypothetical protein